MEALVPIHTEVLQRRECHDVQTFSDLQEFRELWTGYRNTFVEMKPELHNVFVYAGRGALKWTAEDTSDGNTIP